MVKRAVLISVVVFGSCQLPSDVLYKCGSGGTCGADQQCWPDGYCHPLSDGTPGTDGGSTDAGRTDAGANDAGVFDAGTPDGGEVEVDSGTPDGGVDDAGTDAGMCVPVVTCPASVNCGIFDAGCGTTLFCGDCTVPEECGTQRPNVCALPKLCTAGFCWENPLPQGNTLHDVISFSTREVWAVGESGTVLFWNGERTVLHDVGTRADLYGVYGLNSRDLFVVGDEGSIIHFDGTTWTRESTPGSYRINVIWVAPGNAAAFAGANGGSILKRGAGGVWSDMMFSPSNTGDVVGLAPLDTGEVFATTFARVFRLPTITSSTWQGDFSWSSQQRDTLSLAAFGSRLVAGGKVQNQNHGQLYERQSDGGWRQFGPNIPNGFNTVTLAFNGAWLGGNGGVITKLEDDAGIVTTTLSRDGGLYGMRPVSLDDIFVVGEFGTMGFVGDAGARELSWGGTSFINGLCGSGDARSYGAANNSIVFERRSSPSGVRWDSISRPAQNISQWNTCFSDGADRTVILGDRRNYLRQVLGVFQIGDANGDEWSGAWAVPGSVGPWYFVNKNDQLFTGAQITNDPSYTMNVFGDARGIFGVAADDAILVSEFGLKQRNTTSWVDVTQPQMNRSMRAVHAQRWVDGGVLYSIVGDSSSWRRINGSFTVDAIDAGHLRGTYVTPVGDIWAAGEDGGSTNNAPLGRGIVWFFDGDAGTWSQLASPSARAFTSVMGYGDMGPFIGGHGGSILRRIGADGG